MLGASSAQNETGVSKSSGQGSTMANYDTETGEYFWTDEEKAWVATHPTEWHKIQKDPMGPRVYRYEPRGIGPVLTRVSIVEYVQEKVKEARVLQFKPEEGVKYYQTRFRIGDSKEDLGALRVIREFNKETKTYGIVRIEKREFGKRAWKPTIVPEFALEKGPFRLRLRMPGLRIYVTGMGEKSVDFLVLE